LVATVAVAGALWLYAEARQHPTRALLRLVPELAPEVAQHLVHDDDDRFLRYARAAGTVELRKTLAVLERAVDVRSIEAYTRTWGGVVPHETRVANALVQEFDCPDYLRDVSFRAGLSAEQGLVLRRLVLEERALHNAGAMEPRKKIQRLERIIGQLQSAGYLRGVMLAQLSIADEVMKLGGGSERMRLLRHALATARSLGETFMTCQILGEIGAAYHSSGQLDSMWLCNEEARRIAMHCRFPEQLARILLFEAHQYAREGRLALATHFVVEAQHVCRTMGGGGLELRFVAGAMDHFAELGCWKIVERLSNRIPVLLRELERTPWQTEIDIRRLDFARHRARILLANGQIEAALRLWREVGPSYARAHLRVGYADFMDQFTAGLVEAGAPSEALPLIEQGLAHCDSLHVPEDGIGLALRRARVLGVLGRFQQAEVALRNFDRRAATGMELGPPAIDRDVLEARLLDRRGSRREATAVLGRALAELRGYARELDAGPQGYLALAGHDDLRRAMHEIVATDPMSGYRFELRWRALASELGATRRGTSAASSEPAPVPRGSWHCVYWFDRDAIVRWTATANTVVRDTLALTPRDCGRRVGRVLELMAQSSPPVRSDSLELTSALHALAKALLPTEVLGPAAGGRVARGATNRPVATLYVTPDGPLDLLPFEVLNLAPDRLEPLILQHDVAYVRSVGSRSGRLAMGTPSILVDPLATPEVRRRYGIAGALEQAPREAAGAIRAWPGARLLAADTATKDAVLTSWRTAPQIYVAAHLVRDPEIPFLAFFPVAKSRGDASTDGYLELADVRGLDLRGCRLAVLSACASGQPYLAARGRAGPSMGDAFLDAGAGAVVEAFWPVEDEEAGRFMKAFLSEWERKGHDPVRGLNEARRQALEAGRGVQNTWAWAVWSVRVRGVPGRSGVETHPRAACRHGAEAQACRSGEPKASCSAGPPGPG
jgi:hypothetical protein